MRHLPQDLLLTVLASLVIACEFSAPTLPQAPPVPAQPEAEETEAIAEVESRLDTGPQPPSEPVRADSDRVAELGRTLRTQLISGELDSVLADLRAIDIQLKGQTEDPQLHARVKTLLAHAAFRAGEPRLAHRVGRAALELPVESLGEVAWWGGLAAYQLGDADQVEAAAARSEGKRQQVLQALALEARGQRTEAIEKFPSTVPGNEDSALAYLEIARIDPSAAVVWLRRAVESADRAGILPLRIRTRLDLEATHRLQQDYTRAASTRSSLADLARTDGMKAELAARAMLSGVSRQRFPTGDQPEIIQLWAALSSAAPPPSATQALTAPLLSWVMGREERQAGGSGYAHYSAALSTLPVHRQGHLFAGTALDGSMGLPTGLELDQVSGSEKTEDVGVALVLHEIAHRIYQVRAERRAGRDLLFGLEVKPRHALLSAAARSRTQVDLWLSGAGPYPEEVFSRLATEEARAAQSPSLSWLFPSPGWDIEELLADLGEWGMGLISYQQFGYRVHGVALSSHGSFSGDLGQASEAARNASAHRAAMVEHSLSDGAFDHMPGHRVRGQLFDPLTSAFVTASENGVAGAKIGQYLVIAPEHLVSFNLASLSVNQDGLQVLSRSYSFTAHTRLRAPNSSSPSDPAATPSVFLGMGSRLSTDLSMVAAHFGGSGQVLTRAEATHDAWLTQAPRARYIYLSEFNSGPNGELRVHDGLISLDEIATTPLLAELVVIRSMALPEHQRARAQAFLEAGAHAVLILGWEVPDADIEAVIPALIAKATLSRVTGARMAFELKKILTVEAALPGENRYKSAVQGAFRLFSSVD